MSVYLRGLLFVVSVCAGIYITRKIRKSQVQVMDMLFWVVMSALFIVMSLFPGIAIWFASFLGFDSPANFVFLVIIFLLLFRCFLFSIKISRLENRLQVLAEEMAVREAGGKETIHKEWDWNDAKGQGRVLDKEGY